MPALARFSRRRNIAFDLLSDPRSEVIRAFDLLNEEFPAGRPGHGIPHPALFVIDAKGTITHRFIEDRYSDRPDIDAVLKAVR